MDSNSRAITIRPLVHRFLGPVIAAYLLNWGLWWFVFLLQDVVMSVVTRTLNWFSNLRGSISFGEETTVSWRFVPEQIAEAVIPIIFGLLVGYWVMRRKAAPSKSPR